MTIQCHLQSNASLPIIPLQNTCLNKKLGVMERVPERALHDKWWATSASVPAGVGGALSPDLRQPLVPDTTVHITNAKKMEATWRTAAAALGLPAWTAGAKSKCVIVIDGVRRELALQTLALPTGTHVLAINKLHGSFEIMSKTSLAACLRRLEWAVGLQRCSENGVAAGNSQGAGASNTPALEGIPRTWVLPGQFAGFRQYSKMYPRALVLSKPGNLNQGRGIQLQRASALAASFSAAAKAATPFVAQVYIERPMLLDGHKADLRLYLLIDSIGDEHPRAFISRQGLVRASAVPYQEPQEEGAEGANFPMAPHLTNYSLQKTVSGFEKPDARGESGHKRSVSALWRSRDLAALEDHDCAVIWDAIRTIAANAFYALLPSLRRAHRLSSKGAAASKASASHMTHQQIVGIDVLLARPTDMDKGEAPQLKPFLLELNCNPSLTATDKEGQPSPLDGAVKVRVATAALALAALRARETLSTVTDAEAAAERLTVAARFDLDEVGPSEAVARASTALCRCTRAFDEALSVSSSSSSLCPRGVFAAEASLGLAPRVAQPPKTRKSLPGGREQPTAEASSSKLGAAGKNNTVDYWPFVQGAMPRLLALNALPSEPRREPVCSAPLDAPLPAHAQEPPNQ